MVDTIEDVEECKALRKRRLSRKEQKALKKLRNSSGGKPNEDHHIPPTEDPPSDQNVKLEYLSNYKAIPIPCTESSTADSGISLGKWFPKAKTIKSRRFVSNDTQTNTNASLLLFYQYTNNWNDTTVQRLTEYLQTMAQTRILGGRIRLSSEGMNATVSSMDDDDTTTTAAQTLRHFTLDLQQFDPIFNTTDFKFIDNLTPDRHFKDLKLLPVKELVFYGIPANVNLTNGGIHLSAKEFHDKLQQDNTVVVDVRNHYEANIGRFDGQQQGGATYLDPKMRKSTDFTKWLAKPETKEQLKEKQVLMFCTGGVRCERASAVLKHQMGDSVKGCFQLEGGIERYLQTYTDGGLWRGKNFVFDKREAIGAGNMNGDGGIIKHIKANDVGAKCCLCSKTWDRYVGKKKCHMCGVPVLMCDSCMTNRSKDVARCPLCVEEGITVPAVEVEYTNNGVGVRAEKGDQKQASSVLKWGGGHATEKKAKRKLKRRLCQFGAECVRQDCFFAHPEREQISKKRAT